MNRIADAYHWLNEWRRSRWWRKTPMVTVEDLRAADADLKAGRTTSLKDLR